ncbi:conjugal transfer protein [Streptomyces hydrogenans]|uniref:conjugal transfer protein n=1 Tax=Streptomyces hydrogenans TaxID=1873719 RepID=UPI003328E4CA
MPSLATIARKVMGLPEPTTTAKPAAGSAPIPPQAADSLNPWEAAGAELARRQNAALPPRSAPAPMADDVPWAAVGERSGARFAKRFGRGVLWAVVVLAAITGVRSWIVPTKAPAPAAPPPARTAAAYPDAEAQAAAARFARAYLAWDERRAAERAALLAAVLPAGADTAMGWDGRGRQDVVAVEPGAVTAGAHRQARVRVDVLIQTPAAGASPAAPARWVGLDVPVVETSGRVVVSGRPGLVGVPARGPKAPEIPAPAADPALTVQTTDAVATFFKALGGTGTLDTVTAPGTQVPPLPAGIEFAALSSWSVDTGTGSDRTGTAVVMWTLGGAKVEQAYRVELTRVSSADAQRWQVASARGGSL